MESILSEAIKLEYEAYSSLNPRINSRELNDAERAKLNELIVANKALLAPLEEDANSLMSQEAMSKVNFLLQSSGGKNTARGNDIWTVQPCKVK